MNILYISHLTTNIASGMSWSVPASVTAQSKIDNVLWVNATKGTMEHWLKVECFHSVSEYGSKLTLDILPAPFHHPDIVVFEGFYYFEDVQLGRSLRKRGVPYIIIPRGSLTKQALNNHAWLKKRIAHFFFFDSFIKKAYAIQYLTQQEANDSIKKFHTPYFVIPNGFDTPNITKKDFSSNGIRATFIGRLDRYHKGIDLLLEAITKVHAKLLISNFFLTIYGPKRYDYYKIEQEIQEKGIADICAIHDEITGDEKQRVLLQSDIFIMTSRFEGHPMGLIEALSYGIPCMVTPGTNMTKEIYSADAGWICNANVEDIKNTILRIMKESCMLKEKGDNAKILAKSYEWSKLAEAFHKKLDCINKNI